MSILKGNLNSANQFTANDDIRGLRLTAPGSLPSFWGVECGDGVDWYFWVNDDDDLVMHNSAPTSTYDSVGTIVTGSGAGGANKTLSNLGTVALATDLLPNGTIDLGANNNYFAEGFITKLGLYTTNCYITGTSATATLTGNFVMGTNAGAAAYDATFYGETAGQYMKWEHDYSSNAGGLLLLDNVILDIGTGHDVSIASDGADVYISTATGDTQINSGAAADLDWVWESSTVGGDDMAWDASVAILHFADGVKLWFGGAAALTQDDGFGIVFDKSNTLNIDPYAADDVVRIGETNTADLYLDGANGYDMVWDADVDELLLYDNAQLRLGTSATLHLDMWADGTDMHIEAGVANGKVQWGMTNATDLYLHGATANRDAFWDASENEFVIADSAILVFGGNATAGADDLIMTSDGTVVNATLGSTTASLNLITGAGTVHGFQVDGTTGTWVGANNVGLVQINTDGDLKAGGNLLRVDSSGSANEAASFAVEIIVSGDVAGSTLGTALNITDTGAVAGTSYAAYINSTANAALNLVTGAVDKENLVMTGVTDQTAKMVYLDGSTGNGWDGATGTGMLHLKTKDLVHTAASALYIDVAAQPLGSSEGVGIHVIQSTGSARVGAYLVNIEAVATGGGLHVDGGVSLFDEAVTMGATLGVTGAATFTAGQQSTPVTVAAHATKTSAAVASGTTFVNVTSDGATKYVQLPVPVQGHVIWLNVAGTGYELIAADSTTEHINGGKSATEDDASSSIGANTLVRVVAIDTTHWLASIFDTAGDITAVENATST